MKITKYFQSCLVVGDNDKVAILDPDMFTYRDKVFDINSLSILNYILITHSHFDHMSVPFIKELLQKFPDSQVSSNQEVVDALAKEGVKATTQGNEDVERISVQHEKMFGRNKMEENTQFNVFGKLTDPGDSLSLAETKEILALPIIVHWGSTTWAVELAEKLQPKVIIPIHDYLWRDEVRQMFEQNVVKYFAQKGIDFKPLEPGETVEL